MPNRLIYEQEARTMSVEGHCLGFVAAPQYDPRRPNENEILDEDGAGNLVPAPPGQGEQRMFQEAPWRYATALSRLAALGIKQVVSLGDLTYANPTEGPRRKMLSIEQRIKEATGLDVLHVIGNHDCDGADGVRLSREHITNSLGLPPPGYYSVPLNEFWAAVILNTTDAPWYETGLSRESQKRLVSDLENGQPFNGGIGDRQLQWLDQACATATKEGRHSIVIAHHPLTSSRRLPYCMAGDTTSLRQVLSKHSVKAYLADHDHLGGLSQTEDGVWLVTLHSMVNGPDRCPHAAIELKPDGELIVHGFGGQPSYICSPQKTSLRSM